MGHETANFKKIWGILDDMRTIHVNYTHGFTLEIYQLNLDLWVFPCCDIVELQYYVNVSEHKMEHETANFNKRYWRWCVHVNYYTHSVAHTIWKLLLIEGKIWCEIKN